MERAAELDSRKMAKQPALLLYTGDWLKDPALCFCTPATRGVFIDLLCAMHELDRSGELSGTHEQLARTARCSTVDLAQALTDLKTTGAADVTERNGVVTIVNRRMKREAKEREDNRLRQQRLRGHGSCNGNVTSASSLSSSSSNTFFPLIPPALDSPEFRETWGEFVEFRRQIRCAVTELAAKKLLNRLEGFGLTNAIVSLNLSIENNWKGVFEPRKGTTNGNRKPSAAERGQFAEDDLSIPRLNKAGDVRG